MAVVKKVGKLARSSFGQDKKKHPRSDGGETQVLEVMLGCRQWTTLQIARLVFGREGGSELQTDGWHRQYLF